MSVRVISKRAGGIKACSDETIVNIARPSVLGNPFFMRDESQREDVVNKYRVWLRAEYKKKSAVYEELHRLATRSKKESLALQCWCAPCKCHGDVIIEAIEGINHR